MAATATRIWWRRLGRSRQSALLRQRRRLRGLPRRPAPGPDLRRRDLVQDPPISRIDLVTCRNTLMYFTAEVRAKVLANFQFALNPGGHLFLGKSEALVTRTQLFEVVDLAAARRAQGGAAPTRMTVTPPAAALGPGRRAPYRERPMEAAFEQNSCPRCAGRGRERSCWPTAPPAASSRSGPRNWAATCGRPSSPRRPADLRRPVERVLSVSGVRPPIFDVPFHGHDGARTLDIIDMRRSMARAG